jgi:hypothetical protein
MPLTLNEKKQLSQDVSLLSQPQVDEVLKIITERMPLDAGGAGEIELDMDALDTATLRELQRYVAGALGRPVPPQAAAAGGARTSAAPTPVPAPARPHAGAPPAVDRTQALLAQAARSAPLNQAGAPPPQQQQPAAGAFRTLDDDDAPPPPPGF